MKSEITTIADHDATAPAPLWATLIATFFGAGKMRPGPGTWGSAAAALIWFGLAKWLAPVWRVEALAAMAVVAVALGIPAATRVARALQTEDPQIVVIDEVAGQWITLLFAQPAWKTILAGFILFRAFDIVKPPPVRQLERLPEGTGIVVDDVAAGLYALVALQLLIRFGVLPR